MAKKLCMVLGNGFTIDLVNTLDLSGDIDVLNLFGKGGEIPWPETGERGFLSFKYCPNLWNLGVRPNMPRVDAMELLERIITCVNVYVLNPRPMVRDGGSKPNSVYINAYLELIAYLRALFTHYNSMVCDDDLKKKSKDWPWIQFLHRASNSDEYESISIITYNYDIWLERLLKVNGIPFTVSSIDGGNCGGDGKIRIVKPHGSISYYHKNQSPAEYSVGYEKPVPGDATVDSFTIKYDLTTSKCLVNAIIPPAGDTERMRQSWSGQMRASALGMARDVKDGDDLIICGVSYWHVDRAELDEIFTNCSSKANVYMFNPSPNLAMDAVLTSLFSNYIYYSDCSVLNHRLV
ncbi:SIR2 family protein [Vibrio parahaemolyticus]|uniref:SIR2 family protein n=1 Tax=Vibrio parahaemolyticus TaxID=670 RepID=UPI001DC5D080|nr:SIR2 family protein [Vibrio parahaemolyticus]EGQ8307663.1 hypothetical protein [Vibrio parahaemolyticus]EGR2938676.1 hypothetical protein [Vibrio parahaemolyticus]EGR3275163.1 hypothetical protein [Vibrio parahaemolyticus]EGR3309615.1 hypothetical protein [Vibrio parahaemolyticus]EJG0166503.1 hypothetical protein [Vibrio parahaemolyticus]